MNRNRNKDIRGTAHAFEVKSKMPVWGGDCAHIGREVLSIELPGGSPRGRPEETDRCSKKGMRFAAVRG